MVIRWVPLREKIEEDIAVEEARLVTIKTETGIAPLGQPEIAPITSQRVQTQERPAWQPAGLPQPITQQPTMQPQAGGLGLPTAAPIRQPVPLAQPITTPTPTVPIAEEEPADLPFWKRALEVFATPFNWVDETVIQPGLALLGTTAGFVDDVERKPGEDFWEWKKRSWAGWDAPGINLNVPWSDEPWRIDVKGIMEIAPWLLIPGAGQVGVGARVARGVAGMLGKISKPLGLVAEYSPWGLVEKTAGVAIKGGVRAVGKVSERVSTGIGDKLFGKIPPPKPPTLAVNELTKYMKEAVIPARRQATKEIPGLRARQAKIIEEHSAKARRGEITQVEATRRINIELKGKGVIGEFAFTPQALARRQARAIADVEARVVRKDISEAVGESLITKINKNPAYTAVRFSKKKVQEFLTDIDKAVEGGFVAHDSKDALIDLLVSGERALPEPRHIKDWAKVFGNDFAQAAGEFGKLPTSLRGQIIDALNLPRAVLATLDLSATFRQGLILGLTHPTAVPRAFWRQLKYFASEKLSLQMDDMLRSRSLYRNAVRDGVEFQAVRRGASAAIKEEPFLSNLAQNIPFVRKSERAFTGYLNEMRMAAYESAYGAMVSQGASATQFKLMGEFINLASGRGTIPFQLNRYAPLLNTMMFSPRYQVSTLMLPRQLGRMLLSGNPYMRKEAAKALATFVGGGIGLLSLLKSTGVAEVETDPRSTDYGKIKIGETRLDIWRGYVQYARFAAQMLTGESKSANGNMSEKVRFDTAFRFLQSKGSPALGLMVDLLKGENYLGEPIFLETTGFIKEARNRLLPLVVQDIMDAMEQGGANGIWVGAPAALGIGALTYVNDFTRVQGRIARELGYDSWDEIDPKTQREIQNSNVELQAAQIALDRRVMGTAWGDWGGAGRAIEDVFRENVELASAQYRETGDGYKFREKIGDAFTAKRGGYDARNKELRFEDIVERLNIQDTLEADIALGPEQLAIRTYNEALWGDDMYDEFGDYRFDEADIRKEQVRQDLGDEMFNYVEEFRGLKYETLPPEYQELVMAKKILAPYWDIQDRVESIWGKPKTQRMKDFIDRIVSKLRKRLRLADRAVAEAYEKFYRR